MKRFGLLLSPASTCFLIGVALGSLGASPVFAQSGEKMSFFITSEGSGKGADLGGLAGADQHCQTLAESVGAGGRLWRAYLSTGSSAGQEAVHARDRIGPGPWYNARGVLIALDVDNLHGDENNLNKETALTEKGEVVNGRGDSPNQHDILTGSQLDGTAFADGADLTCQDWTSDDEGSAQLGHHDRQGGGANPTSWNSAHASRGCSQTDLQGTGGNGYFYCFAPALSSVETAVWDIHGSGQPTDSVLYQNYPNPFNSETVFRFDLVQRRDVDLRVYNLEGQRVSTLVSGSRGPGNYVVRWNGRDDDGRALASGIYLYRLEAGGLVETRKLLLVR